MVRKLFLCGIVGVMLIMASMEVINEVTPMIPVKAEDNIIEDEVTSTILSEGFEIASGHVFLLEERALYLDEACTITSEYILPIKCQLEKVGLKGDIYQVSYNGESFYIPSSLIAEDLKSFYWDFSLEGNVSDESIMVVSECMEIIPSFIRNSFKEDGWNYLIDEENINQKYNESKKDYEIAGLTSYSRKMIFFGNYGESLRKAVIHEFGHYYDFRLNPDINSKFSDSDEFQRIFSEEKDNLGFIEEILSSHAKEKASEFFAESFQQYFSNPELLKEACPQTFDCINTLLANETLSIE